MSFKGFNLNTPYPYTIQQLRDEVEYQAALGSKIVRFPISLITTANLRSMPPQDYWQFIYGSCNRYEAIRDIVALRGMKTILDLHHPPGGKTLLRGGTAFNLDFFVEVWKYIAERFKNDPTIGHFELLNEPYVVNNTKDYLALMQKTINAVSAITTNKQFIVMCPSDGPAPFRYMRPVTGNVIYAFHYYLPYEVTFKGVPGFRWVNSNAVYKGTVNRVIANIKDVLRFRDRYHATVVNTEFACSKFSPYQAKWTQDCINAFQSKGIGWIGNEYATIYGVWTPKPDTTEVLRKALLS